MEADKAKSYHSFKTALFFSQLTIGLILLAAFYFSGLSFSLRQFTQTISQSFFAVIFIYTVLFYFLSLAFKLPFSYLEDYLLEKKFSLFTGTIKHWLGDFLKEVMIELIITIILVTCLYLFLKISNLWWFYIWVVYLALSVLLAKITPYLILPLFFKFTPLENIDIKEAVEKLAKYFNIKVATLWSVDFSKKTKKSNAFVCGLGKNKRVAFADNLINNYSIDEIEAVMAHEFAHVKNKDTFKQVFIVGGGSLVVFFIMNMIFGKIANAFGNKIYDVDTLPLFLILLEGFIFFWLPIQNFLTRTMEKKADLMALAATNNPNGFVSLMEKLGKDNLAETFPPKWKEIIFYSHPPLGKRIDMAKNYKNENR